MFELRRQLLMMVTGCGLLCGNCVADPAWQYRALAESTESDSALYEQPSSHQWVQSVNLEWQQKLSGQEFNLAAAGWNHYSRDSTRFHHEVSELWWARDASDWRFSVGKRKRDFDVNYALRPLDLFSPTDPLALYNVVEPGVWQLAADWYGADNALTLLCNETSQRFLRYGKNLPASSGCGARYYQQHGELEWQGLVHWDQDIGWRTGGSLVAVLHESLALQGSVLWQQYYWTSRWIDWPSSMTGDLPIIEAAQQQGAWQVSAGLNYTHPAGWNLLLEYGYDEQAPAASDWMRFQKKLHRSTLQPMEQRSGRQLYGGARLIREQWLLHLRGQGDWQPTMTLLYQPAVKGMLISAAIHRNVADNVGINLGIKHFAGPVDNPFRLLGLRSEVVAGVTYAF